VSLIAETIEFRLGRRFNQMHGVKTFAYVTLSSLGYGSEERGLKQRGFALSSVHARAEDFVLSEGNWALDFDNPFEKKIMAKVLGDVLFGWNQSRRTISLVFFRIRFRSLVEQFAIFHELP
jgi:hypothetical protein